MHQLLLPSFAEKIICYDENLKGISKKLLHKIYLVQPFLRKEIYKYQKNYNTKIAEKKKNIFLFYQFLNFDCLKYYVI